MTLSAKVARLDLAVGFGLKHKNMVDRFVRTSHPKTAVLSILTVISVTCAGLAPSSASAEPQTFTLKGQDFSCEVFTSPVKLQCLASKDTPKTLTFAGAKAERISSPERFFIDFPGFSVTKTLAQPISDSELISGARIGSPQKGSSRIVLDLKADLAFEFKLSPNAKKLSVEFSYVGPSPIPSPVTEVPAESGPLTESGEPSKEVTEVKSESLEPTETESQKPTQTPKPSPTTTFTLRPTATPRPTGTPSQTPTMKPSASPTRSPKPTQTPKPTATTKPTGTPTETPTDKPTASPTRTPRPTETPSPTQTPKPTGTPTQTPTEKPTTSPTRSPEPTQTPKPSPTPSLTPKPSPTLKPTGTPSPVSTESPKPSPTDSPLPTETPKPSMTPPPKPSETEPPKGTSASAPSEAMPRMPSPTASDSRASQQAAPASPISTEPSTEAKVSDSKPTESAKPGDEAHHNIQLSLPLSELQPEKVLLFSVDKSFLEFEPGDRPIRDVKVVNKTEKAVTLYSKVDLVVAPGTAAEAFQPTDKFVSSPKRFEIAPLGVRTIRLLALEESGARPPEGELTYRVSIFPQEESAAEKTVEAKTNQGTRTFNVLAGLALTAVVSAPGAEAKISFEASKDSITFTNSGTRTAALENCANCPMSSAECSTLPRRLIAPSAAITIPISGKGLMTCDARAGVNFKKITVPYGTTEVK